jgi:hypothetical protein
LRLGRFPDSTRFFYGQPRRLRHIAGLADRHSCPALAGQWQHGLCARAAAANQGSIRGQRPEKSENDRLQSEVNDLKDGLSTVEEKARYELGMVKPNEIYIQVSKR